METAYSCCYIMETAYPCCYDIWKPITSYWEGDSQGVCNVLAWTISVCELPTFTCKLQNCSHTPVAVAGRSSFLEQNSRHKLFLLIIYNTVITCWHGKHYTLSDDLIYNDKQRNALLYVGSNAFMYENVKRFRDSPKQHFRK